MPLEVSKLNTHFSSIFFKKTCNTILASEMQVKVFLIKTTDPALILSFPLLPALNEDMMPDMMGGVIL